MSRLQLALLFGFGLAVVAAAAWMFLGEDSITAGTALLQVERAQDSPQPSETLANSTEQTPAPIPVSTFHDRELMRIDGHVVGIVLDRDGTPIAGAAIGLHEFMGPEPVLNTELAISATATADGDGRFQIPCPPFPSVLIVEAEGFLPEVCVPVNAGGIQHVVLQGGAEHSFRVTDAINGAALSGVMLRITRGQRLPPCSVLTDANGLAVAHTLLAGDQVLSAVAPAHLDQHDVRITVSASGLGLTELRLEHGKSVVGRVSSRTTQMAISGAKISSAPHKFTHSDADGHYELRGLADEHADLSVVASGYRTVTRNVLLKGSRARADVNWQLHPAASIRGMVVDPRGVPLRGASVFPVTFDRESMPHRIHDGADAGRMTTTGEDGRFCADGFAADENLLGGVLVDCAPWLPKVSAPVPLQRAGDCGEVVVQMQRAQLLLAGIVTDDRDQPAADVEVQLEHYRNFNNELYRSLPPRIPVRKKTRTDSKGCFSFADLPPSKYVVQCRTKEAYATSKYRLRENQPADPLKLVLQGLHRVVVRCLDSSGNPVLGASVAIGSEKNWNSHDAGVTKDDGRVTMQVVSGPPYQVWVNAAEFERERHVERRGLTPNSAGVIELTLDRGTGIQFEVRQMGTALIPPEIRWYTTPQGKSPTYPRKVDPDPKSGRVRLEIEAGDQVLTVGCAGMLPFERQIHVPPDAILDLGRIELPTGASADGHVHLSDGRVPDWAKIAFRTQARGNDPCFRPYVLASWDGWFHVSGLVPGTYEIAVETKSAPLTIFSGIEISESQGRGLDLRVQPESAVHVRLSAEWMQARLGSNKDARRNQALSNEHLSWLSSSRYSTMKLLITNKDGRPLELQHTLGADHVLGSGLILSPTLQLLIASSGTELLLRNLPSGAHHARLQHGEQLLFETDFEAKLGATTVVEPQKN